MRVILETLRQEGAVYTGEHFVYTAGDHGSDYVNLRPLYPYTGVIYWLMCDLLMAMQGGPHYDVVIGPDFGGNELAEMAGAVTARWWEGREHAAPKVVRTLKTEDDDFIVHPKRHYEQHLEDCRALVLDDVFTTGSSVKKVITLVEQHGGSVVAVGGVVDRGCLNASTFGVEAYTTLEQVALESFQPLDCPYCEMGWPMVVNLGHGSKFQEANPGYTGGFKEL